MSFPRRHVRKHGIYRRRLVVLYPKTTVLKAIDSISLQFSARNDMSLRTCENRKKLIPISRIPLQAN
jgi:hypothetical protein